MRFGLVFLLAVLTACTLPSVGSQAVSRISPPLEPVGTYSLQGDPNFNPSQLSSEMQVWHARALEGIEQVQPFRSTNDPETSATSGNLFLIGRYLNVYITSLLTSLRATGDLTFLDEADRLMELTRPDLVDTNGDGYRNWLEKNYDANAPSLYMTDEAEMDEILTHSLVAAFAAALKANEAFDPRYAEHAAFWTDYLQNDFEAKWRKRNDKPTGLPVLEKDLMHPYVQFIRYHHYMYELTGDVAYQEEAERRAELVREQVREVLTPSGPAYVWDQRFLPDTEYGQLACQPLVYLQYTFQTFQDLAVEGTEVFDTAFMQRVATTMTDLMMKDSYRMLATDVCGGTFQQGLYSKASTRGVPFFFVNFPYATIGKWDTTGKIEQAVRDAYSEVDFEDPHYAIGPFNLPAAMLFLLADNGNKR